MSGGSCVGLHPYGPCAHGEGCNRERCGVFELGGPCDDERAPGFEVCRYHLRRELNAARARVAELEAELAKVKGYQAELAERCYRKDLELDELRPRRGIES